MHVQGLCNPTLNTTSSPCAKRHLHEGVCMFILSEVEDKVRVAPADLGRPVLEAVTAVIEKNYIDKVFITKVYVCYLPRGMQLACKTLEVARTLLVQVVNDLGLVITIYDITHIDGGFIYPSDGAAHYDVRFKLVVFRPFPGEVIAGRLARSTRRAGQTGLYTSKEPAPLPCWCFF